MFKSAKKYLFLIWSIAALLLIAVVVYWYYGVTNIDTQRGRLIINKMSDTSLLESYQSQVDYLIDLQKSENSYYTAIIPYNVVAGIDLDKLKIEKNKDKKLIDIQLPEPKILKVDQSDKVERLKLRDEGSGGQFGLFKQWKVFAQKKAKMNAYKKNILSKAVDQTDNTLTQFVQTSFPNFKVNMSKPEIPEPEYLSNIVQADCFHLPIMLEFVNYNNIEIRKNTGSKDRISEIGKKAFHGYISGIYFWVRRFGKTAKFEKLENHVSLARLFDPSNPGVNKYIEWNDKGKQLHCFFPGDSYTYAITFDFDSRQALANNFDSVLNVCYGLKFNPDFDSDIASDETGLTLGIWEKMSLNQKMNYIWNHIFRYNRIITDKPNVGNEIRLNDVKRPVIYSNEFDDYEDKEYLNQYIEDIYKQSNQTNIPNKNKCISIVYDEGEWGHRTRLFVFYPKGFLYYTPKRLVQDRLCKYYKYAETDTEEFTDKINYGSDFGLKIEGAYKSVNNADIGKFLTWFFQDNYNVVDLYAQKN